MLRILAYETEDDPARSGSDTIALFAADEHVWLAGEEQDLYRPGRWTDPATGAYAVLDCGTLPLAADPDEKPKGYAGWRQLPVLIQILLAGPHWYAAEVFNWLARLKQQHPDLGFLLEEDTGRPEDDDFGPGLIETLRGLACWEELANARRLELGVPSMERSSSLALWRYRREKNAGKETHPKLLWPDALVLRHENTARSVAILPQQFIDLALPPVEFVVVQRPSGPGLLPADELIAAAQGGSALSHGGAQLILAGGMIQNLLDQAQLMPTTGFQALDDEDWQD